ncbi:MAG: hypothetical protein UY50_C0008G0002 [Parcubacteria group bacterium GW2011_GWA2_49_9]|nr:MAG: hypothetical protein UY50_C0008G0002 [Parcubacteria group bacterium GW2011_GWA2_49_9]
MKSVQKNLKKIEEHGKGVFWTLACFVLFATSLYVYLLNTTSENGARWGKVEKEISSRGANVSELESRYLSLKQSVTLKVAYAKGFEDVKTVRFISTQKVGAVATAKEI